MTAAKGIDTNKLRQLRDALQVGLVERDLPVRLALLAILAGEHTLLLGPPGTAKSMVARRLNSAIKDGQYFERLLTRFSVPEELFGPLSLKALEQDRYERQTSGYLPMASVAFLDEIFKANSAILNSMLTLLNEREFDNGTQRVRTPLVGVVAASNELPDGPELEALFDRFLIRVHVSAVSREGFGSLLAHRTGETQLLSDELRLDASVLQLVKDAAARVILPTEVLEMLADLRDWCAAEGIAVSDRRWRQLAGLLRTAAATHGRDHVSIWDCWLMQHCVWNRPEDHEKVAQWFAQRVAASGEVQPGNVTRLLASLERRLERDQSNRAQKRDEEGNFVFLGFDGIEFSGTKTRPSMRNGEPLYLAPLDAFTDGQFGRRVMVKDRTNGGRGFSILELESLRVSLPEGWTHFGNWSNRKKYLADTANHLMEEDTDRPVMIPAPQPRAHVDALLADVAKIENHVELYRTRLEQHRQSLDDQIRTHLWVMPDFLAVARSSLDRSAEVVADLVARVHKLRQGIESLPIELPFEPCDQALTKEGSA